MSSFVRHANQPLHTPRLGTIIVTTVAYRAAHMTRNGDDHLLDELMQGVPPLDIDGMRTHVTSVPVVGCTKRVLLAGLTSRTLDGARREQSALQLLVEQAKHAGWHVGAICRKFEYTEGLGGARLLLDLVISDGSRPTILPRGFKAAILCARTFDDVAAALKRLP